MKADHTGWVMLFVARQQGYSWYCAQAVHAIVNPTVCHCKCLPVDRDGIISVFHMNVTRFVTPLESDLVKELLVGVMKPHHCGIVNTSNRSI